jgi:hypothetical protein
MLQCFLVLNQSSNKEFQMSNRIIKSPLVEKQIPTQNSAKEKTVTVRCASCGTSFQQSDYSSLADCIMRNKPACSFECNVKLGQAKPKIEYS